MKPGVIAKFFYQMLNGLEVVINGTGEQERDFVFVGDIAQANLLAIRHFGNGVYNLGNERGTSVNSLFKLMKSLSSYKKEPLFAVGLKGEIVKTCLTADKAKRELGWKPETSLEEGLRSTLEYFKRRMSFETSQPNLSLKI